MENATALKAEAQAIDAEVAAASAPIEQAQTDIASPAAPVVDVVAEARMIVDFFVSMFKRVSPSIEKIYDEKAKQDIAVTLGPLLLKYNLAGGAWAQKWKEEIAFGMVAVPLAFATYDAVKAERDIWGKKPAEASATVTESGAAPAIQ